MAFLKFLIPSPKPLATSGIFFPPNSRTATTRMTTSSGKPIDRNMGLLYGYNSIVGGRTQTGQANAGSDPPSSERQLQSELHQPRIVHRVVHHGKSARSGEIRAVSVAARCPELG